MPVTLPLWSIVLLLLFLCILIVIAILLTRSARRLNSLHVRVDASQSSLISALHNRATVVKTLAPDREGPPENTDFNDRADAEDAFLSTLPTEILENPQFVSTHTRVNLASRFYNEAVVDLRHQRKRTVVRLFRLSGHAPWPVFYEATNSKETF